MTKRELKQKILEFISLQENTRSDEWWCTDMELAEEFMERFAKFVGVDLEEFK